LSSVSSKVTGSFSSFMAELMRYFLSDSIIIVTASPKLSFATSSTAMEVALDGHKSMPVKSTIFSFESETPGKKIVTIRDNIISNKNFLAIFSFFKEARPNKIRSGFFIYNASTLLKPSL